MGANGGGGISFDTDALAFISAASITDATQKSAVNKLVTDLKSASIWTKMKAIYPFVGGTASQHRFNLKDPRALNVAFYLDFINGWTHSATGAKPNGTDGYADTKLAANSLTVNNTHISYYSRTSTITNNERDIACYQNADNPCLALGTNTGVEISDSYSYLSGRVSASISDALGLYIGTRTNTTTHKSYKNGSQIGTTNIIINAQSLPTTNIFIGAANLSPFSSNGGSFSQKQQAFASIGNGLTDTDASNLYTAVQTFNTTLGRQV